MISLGPPNPQPDPSLRFHYYRDIFSLFTLDLNAIITDFDLKTWGFLVYPGDYDEQANPFKFLIRCVLLKGIIPLASFFSAYGVVQHVYCQRFKEFVKEQLKNFAGSWHLMEHLIGI
jgi:hypothetical protein